MAALTYREFVEARGGFDGAVALTPQVSRFCSASAWALAAYERLDTGVGGAEGTPLLIGEGNHWLAFAPRGAHYFQPLEGAWMFGCPLVGPEPERSIALLKNTARRVVGEPRGYIVGGVERMGDLHARLRTLGAGGLKYQELEGVGAMLIDLGPGIDAWLGRRSRKFRKNLRAADKKVREAGITIETANGESDAEELFQRIFSIQQQTGKWSGGTDIFHSEDCRRFYRQLLGDLQQSGRLRLQFARKDGRDIAHIFGGVFGDTYRGLQMSYLEEFAALGLGNLLQWDNLTRMEKEGIRTYDLGMPSEYKYRWADRERKTVISLVVL